MTKSCPACNGTGISRFRKVSDPTILGSEIKCLTCRGTGQMSVVEENEEFFGDIKLPDPFFDRFKEETDIPVKTNESLPEDTVIIVAPGEKPLWIPEGPVEIEEKHEDGETHIKVKAKGRVNEKETKKRIAVAKTKKG